MCGIAGIISRVNVNMRSKVRRMTDLLAHRGPDDAGLYEDNEACLGHRRLAIIDLTQTGHQPMIDGSGVLVFNGEIYNYKSIRAELVSQGAAFRSQSDTEVILRGYQIWGTAIVSKLKGMFAFALWDKERHRLFCARDPFGKKPFYYSWDNGRFIFASEVEALVAGLGTRPNLDQAGLSHYLLKGYFAPGHSAYKSIKTLLAGHCLELRLREENLRQWPYWQDKFRLAEANPGSPREVIETVEERLRVAVRRRFESDVPVGVLVSGGVDSSLVSLVSAEQMSSPVRTFTATFKGTPQDEARFALQIARRARSQHLEVAVDMGSLPSLLPRLIAAYGEPFADYSAIPTFCLFEAIKPYVKVVLTGDGGDEIFAGYKDTKLFVWRQILQYLAGATEVLPAGFLESLISSRQRRLRELGYFLMAMRREGAEVFGSLHFGGWTSLRRRQCLRPEAWRTTGENEVEQEDARLFRSSGRTDLERFLNRYFERLTQSFLVKVDRAAMAHSVEARSPMLDADLFAYVKGLPETILLDGGEPKSILKRLLAARMGDAFAKRPKMGFTPPLASWFRTAEASAWLEGNLTDKGSLIYSLFEPDKIRELIASHRYNGDHTGRLWNLVFLNSWHNHFNRA